jgi:hypothetical protein
MTVVPFPIAECARCGREFVQRRSDHRFCTPECRKLGEWKPGDRPPVDHAQIARLFDESRDPGERVRRDDWFPAPADSGWVELYLCETVETRRRWYLRLVELGRL